ncbi:PLAT/LH2 domain-containing protein [Bacillus bombysepticus]|uniref:PLAT/LH2 domain-containing protein n=1 Tax=Bacillus bombysepticus TaxID=658666 RepID=UPI003017202C
MSHKYTATIVTGNMGGAGTDAIVKLTIIGTSGQVISNFGDKHQTFECPKTDSLTPTGFCFGWGDPFEKGTLTTYDIDAKEFIGEIIEINVEVDDRQTVDNPAWYLLRVDIHTFAGGEQKTWKFPVERWIGTGKDPFHREDQVNKLRVNQSGPII